MKKNWFVLYNISVTYIYMVSLKIIVYIYIYIYIYIYTTIHDSITRRYDGVMNARRWRHTKPSNKNWQFLDLKKLYLEIFSVWSSIQFEQVFRKFCPKNCNYLTPTQIGLRVSFFKTFKTLVVRALLDLKSSCSVFNYYYIYTYIYIYIYICAAKYVYIYINRGAGGTMVVCVSVTTVTRVWFWLHFVAIPVLPRSHVGRVVQFLCTQHDRFSLGIFRWTSRINSLASSLGYQVKTLITLYLFKI